MTGLVIFLFSALVSCALAVMAAMHDWRGLKIPNFYAAAIALLFGVAYIATTYGSSNNTYFISINSHIIAFFITFIVTFIMYSLKMLGAGDSKMAAAMALWAGTTGLPAFLFYTSFAGGLLALAAITLRRMPAVPACLNNGWVVSLREGRGDLPYGLALAMGFFIMMLYRGAFNPETLQQFISQ